jgi:RNA polymerase-binding transcription factor DksA
MEKPLSSSEIHAFERRLRELRTPLAERIAAVESATLESPGSTQLPQEDEALEQTSMDEGVELLSSENELRQAVDDALDRIASGTYGACMTCGTAISRERLDVLPYASRCVQCAQREESAV